MPIDLSRHDVFLDALLRVPELYGARISPDGRWAFISVESVGADPGAVDVIDLSTRERVASLAVPRQPTGITILPVPE